MGATHFRLRTLEKVGAEMSLHVLASPYKYSSPAFALFRLHPPSPSVSGALYP
jgi:hypothetical protein